jgi:Uma2 family endonuclease
LKKRRRWLRVADEEVAAVLKIDGDMGGRPMMETLVQPAEQRFVLRNVSWKTYEHLLADFADRRSPRFTYDRGTLEIMSPLPQHETLSHNLAMLVEIAAEARDLDVLGLGSTTFKREDLERGFEPDACFYVRNAERMRDKEQIDLTIDPPPDLVIEIEQSRSSISKLSIYAQIGVPEVWRHTGQRLVILVLREGTYHEQDESAALPGVKSDRLMELLEESRSLRRPEWLKHARAWALSLAGE